MKILKIIIINFVLLFIIIISLEYFLYIKQHKYEIPFIHSTGFLAPKFDEEYKKIVNEGFYAIENHHGVAHFRTPVINKNKKKPIIIFGCSIAWGARLQENQTFHYKLSKLTYRSVYNRSICGMGIQHMLYQLKREDFYKDIPEPEYIIYVYIGNHISRMYKYNYICDSYDYNYLKYNNVFGKLKEEKRLQNIPYSRLYNDIILRFIAKFQESKFPKLAFNFLEKHLLESKKELEKHWKNTKFVILEYESEDKSLSPNINVLSLKNIKKLEKDGFIVIKTSDLTDIPLGKNYYLDEMDHHPNEAAWDLITPLFVEKLKSLR